MYNKANSLFYTSSKFELCNRKSIQRNVKCGTQPEIANPALCCFVNIVFWLWSSLPQTVFFSTCFNLWGFIDQEFSITVYKCYIDYSKATVVINDMMGFVDPKRGKNTSN